MAHNSTPSNSGDTGTSRSSALSPEFEALVASDPERSQKVADAAFDPWMNGEVSEEAAERINAFYEERGRPTTMNQVDRTQQVGAERDGGRSSDWKDERIRRMYALDQSMSENDEARSPTMESTDALFRSTEYLNHALAQTQALAPELVAQLQFADRYLIMYPELAITTRNGYGLAGITEQVTDVLMGYETVEEFAQAAEDSYLLQSDIGDQFYTMYGNSFDPDTKNMLLISLAGLSGKEQKHMFGLMAAYLDGQPLNTLEDQQNFANWFVGQAKTIYDRENDQSGWGKAGRVLAHVFTNPADFFQDEVLGSLWTSASDGADSWYRQELQLEETMAISMGHDVGTSGWNTFTGLAGGVIDVVIDPVNLLFGGLGAMKAIRTGAYIDDALRGTNRFRGVARQFVPFRSKKAAQAIGLPQGVVGRSSRIAWTLFAKSQDGLMVAARKNGVFKIINETSSTARVIARIPALRKVDPGIIELLMRQDGEEAVEAMYLAALNGGLLDPASMAHQSIILHEIDTASDLKRVLNEQFIEEGVDGARSAFTAGDIANAEGGGLYHNYPLVLDEVEEIKIVARGGDDAITNIKQLDGGDIQDIINNTDDPAILARIDDYNAGGKQVGDEVDDAIMALANKRRGTEELVSDATAFPEMTAAAQRAIDAGVPLRKVPFEIADGVMGTAEIGQSAQHGRVTIVRNAAGEIVGGRVDQLGGVAEDARKKGIYQRILELQRDELGLTAKEYADATGPLTADAARVGERVFGQAGVAVAKNTGVQANPLDKGVVSYIRKNNTVVTDLTEGSKAHTEALEWIAKNTKYRNKGIAADGSIRKDALHAYMRAHNTDIVVVNGSAIFVDLEGLKAAGKIDQFVGGAKQHAGLDDAVKKLATAKYEVRMVAPKNGEVSKWVISDMPSKVTKEKGWALENVFFWRKSFGVFEGKAFSEASWLKRHARGLVASVFLDDMPARIATGYANRQDGVRDITRMLTQMGVDPHLVAKSIDEYMAEPTQAVVLQIIRNASDDLGDAELSLGLMHFLQKQTDQLEYAAINGGDQLTMGRRVDDGTALQPLLPSQLSQAVQLPDQKAFSAHVRRVKRSTARTFQHRNRGWGKTKKNRQALIDDFGRQLEGTESGAKWDALTEDERWATAYAVVRPQGSGLGDGLGYGAKFGQYAGEKWGRLRNAFSVSMLAWRPIGWMGNEMLDNAWRASLADGLSFFTKPFESVKAIYASRRIAKAMEERALYQAATRGILKMLDTEAPTVSVLLDRVATAIPDIRKYIDSELETTGEVADAVRKFLNTELITNTDVIKVLDDPLAAALYRQRKGYEAAVKYELPMNVKGELFNPDWDDIALTGMEHSFTASVGSASARHEWALGIRRQPNQLEDYGEALSSVWARDMRDPVVRMYLAQLASVGEGGQDSSLAARTFVNSGSWQGMEEPIRNMARFDGMAVDGMNDLELAEWYFKMKIKPYVEDTFGDALVSANFNTMRHGKLSMEIDGVTHLIDVDDPASIHKMVQAANGTQTVLPKSVVGLVNPRSAMGYGKVTDGWKTPLASYNAWALDTFGTKIPRNLQRRPAYISAFKRFKQNYIALGMSEKGADFAASQKAVEHINKTFFFVEAQTPMLKKMNEIFPFFAAQYEIVKAWTWNIPAAQGAYGIGHARMLRTFDKIHSTLRENGLLQPSYDRDGKVNGWNMQFAQDPHTDNKAGMFLSRAGHLALMAPVMLIEQIAEIALQSDFDLTGDEINFKFNHPYEFFAKGGGLLPTGRLQFGMNPVMGLPVSKLNDALPFTSTSNAQVVVEDSNLDLWIAENGVLDKTEFLTANREILLSSGAVTEEELLRLNSGTMGFASITLPKGIHLYIPGTTLAGQFIKNLLFPYGQTDSIQEVVSDFTPKVLSNMAKTMGLFLNDGEDGATMWLPNLLMGPTGRSGMGMARADALIVLEMQAGVLTRSADISNLMRHEEPGTPRYIELLDELTALDSFITKEVKEIAASNAFVATMFSAVMPFSPRMPNKAQTLRSYYFQARTTADQWAEGTPMPMAFDGKTAEEGWNMVAAWAADESGTQAKMEFLKQHGGQSSILAAIAPRTYWGGTGLPVWDMEQYFQQVKDGDIVPLPFDVLRYKIRSSQIQIEREMVFVEEYGNDPMQQALAMIHDGARLTEISELYNEKWRALEMEDELVNDGAWIEFMADNPENYVDIAYNEQLEKIEALDIAMQEIELDLYPSDPQEARRMQQKLQGIRNTLYDMVNVYNDGRYADWNVSPRQAILNEYWEAWAEYSDLLQVQYEKVSEANTSEELSIAYDSIARWRKENEHDIIVDGFVFDRPSVRSWNALDDEHKKSLVDSKLNGKLEWLSYGDMDHIIEIYPAAASFLPMSEEARNIFNWKSDQDALIARKYRIGGPNIDIEEGTGKYRLRTQRGVEEEFDRRLRAAGEVGVIETLANYPIENMEQWGALPQSFEWLIPHAVAAHRQLGTDKYADGYSSPGSNAGKIQQRFIFSLVLQRFEEHPQERDGFITFGMRVFQESTVEGIVAKLLGNYQGSLE